METTGPAIEQTCYRHGDRRAGVRCQRCERPICPQCMSTASVGFHCPECARGGRQTVVTRANLRQAAARLNRPWLTQGLVAVNVAVFVVGMVMAASSTSAAGNLFEGTTDTLTLWGALIARPFQGFDGVLYQGVAGGEWWRIVTAGFLHAGLLHLGFNMFALYRIGTILEPFIGRARFAAAYAASLLAGSFGALLLSPDTLTVGASGAIFGLFGFLFMATRARGIDPWSSGIGMTIGLNLLITFSFASFISVGGHVGGLAGGALCGAIVFELGEKGSLDARRQVAAMVALAAALFVGCLAIA